MYITQVGGEGRSRVWEVWVQRKLTKPSAVATGNDVSLQLSYLFYMIITLIYAYYMIITFISLTGQQPRTNRAGTGVSPRLSYLL